MSAAPPSGSAPDPPPDPAPDPAPEREDADARDLALRRELLAALQRLAPDAERLLLAVSGGGDSVALLSLLRGARDAGELDAELVVAHFDHRLRPESGDDAVWVATLAERWGVPFETGSAPVARVAAERGWNLEAAARRLRYDFLHRAAAARNADAVLVAHTRDDQAETVLLQLLRGAAFGAGMPARGGRVVRPLLGVGRTELRAHLVRRGLEPRRDPSNADETRRRAALRRRVLPELERIAPGAAERLARFAALQRDQRAFIEGETERRFGDGALPLGALSRAEPAQQRAALAALLRRAGAPVDLRSLDAILGELARRGPAATWRRDVGGGVRVRAHGGRLDTLQHAAEEAPAPLESRPLRDVPLSDLTLHGAPPEALLNDAAADPEIVWRTRRPGDTIELPGGRKKLAELMIDRKIPREARAALPLAARGAAALWIPGLATAARYRTPGTPDPADPERDAMRAALAEAEAAAAAAEVPIGALVLGPGGRVLARAQNRTRRDGDPTAHAETLALRAAARARGDWRLQGCTLVVTLEPCPMCYGAALNAHLARVVWGAANRRDGALGSVVDLAAAPTKRHPELRGGVLAGPCARLLERFFAARRAEDT